MAILVEEIDDSATKNDDLPSLETLLGDLAIPSAYARYNTLEEDSTISELAAWKSRALSELKQLQSLLKQLETTLEDASRVIVAVAPFASDSDGEWTSSDMSSAASSVLDTFEPSTAVLEEILTHRLKPIFASTPHPRLNAETGRKLPRALGGPMAAQDLYDGQVWKTYPGISAAVLWCVERVSVRFFVYDVHMES